MTIDLAKIFSDLANDPSWPWHVEWKLPHLICDDSGRFVADAYHLWRNEIAQSPLNMACLALMVVDTKSDVVFLRHEAALKSNILLSAQTLAIALDNYHITPDHYTNVKERVEKAIKKGKGE